MKNLVTGVTSQAVAVMVNKEARTIAKDKFPYLSGEKRRVYMGILIKPLMAGISFMGKYLKVSLPRLPSMNFSMLFLFNLRFFFYKRS